MCSTVSTSQQYTANVVLQSSNVKLLTSLSYILRSAVSTSQQYTANIVLQSSNVKLLTSLSVILHSAVSTSQQITANIVLQSSSVKLLTSLSYILSSAVRGGRGSSVVRWVIGLILHGGPIELFLVPASAPLLV